MAKKSDLWILASDSINKTVRYVVGAAVLVFVFNSHSAQQFILELVKTAPKEAIEMLKYFSK